MLKYYKGTIREYIGDQERTEDFLIEAPNKTQARKLLRQKARTWWDDKPDALEDGYQFMEGRTIILGCRPTTKEDFVESILFVHEIGWPKPNSLEGWLRINGTMLLTGYLRAREDGSDEPFEQWLLGEYDHYCEYFNEEDYEVPYHGVADTFSEAERWIGSKAPEVRP